MILMHVGGISLMDNRVGRHLENLRDDVLEAVAFQVVRDDVSKPDVEVSAYPLVRCRSEDERSRYAIDRIPDHQAVM
jgi:hypothetical protein